MEWEGRVASLKIEQVIEALQIEAGQRVADVGAGTGLFSRPLAGAVGDEGIVYAVDINSELLQHIEDRARREGTGNIRTVLSGPDDPLLPETVDLISQLKKYTEDVPRLEITARATYHDLLRGRKGAYFLHLPGIPATFFHVAERTYYVRPGTTRVIWHLKLPQGLGNPEPGEFQLDNDVGSFRQSIALKEQLVTIDRRIDLRRRWLDASLLDPLKKLSREEHRIQKQRIQLKD